MKHTLKITLILVLIFFITQIIGLVITNEYLDHKIIKEEGKIVFEPLPYNLERPQIEETTSFIWIIAAILIGTAIFLVLIKYKIFKVWKVWFFVAVWVTLSIALSAFLNQFLAAIIALIATLAKIYKPNIVMQNLTEVFIYGGLAAIFVPILNIFAAIMLLILISVYDVIAVYKTKHMIKLAKFQAKSKIFAGLLIPYGKLPKLKAGKGKLVTKKTRIAVLGGGDIGFPLIFAGVVMKGLMLENIEIIGFLKTLIIPVFVSLALLYLLIKGKKDKFYPAMPYVSVGCFIGYAIVLLLF
jgi:presenilin-like A22 family membrane protease